MQIESGWTIPHDTNHQFLVDTLPLDHPDLRGWVDHFQSKGVKFDLVECPVGMGQIYKHRRLAHKNTWKKCCVDYDGGGTPHGSKGGG